MAHAPYHVDLDPDTARLLTEKGATVLMLDVPMGSLIGVDQQAFAAGPKFKGLKMLPPGPHFFSCRPASSSSGPAPGACAPPTGFFLHLAPGQVVVKVWDAATEQLLDMQDEEEAQRYAAGVRRFDFDSSLAPYDLTSFQNWARISGHVSSSLISRLSPVGGNISIMAEAEDPHLLDPKTEAERQLVQQLQEGKAKMMGQHAKQPGGTMDIDAPRASGSTAAEADAPAASCSSELDLAPQRPGAPGGRCFYTHLPRLVKQRGVSAAELTALNLDKSAALLQAVGQRYDGDLQQVLGELQFAFIAFVFGQSLDGFSQWKSLLSMLLACEDAALHSQQATFTKMLRVVRAQLAVTLGPESSGGQQGQGQGQEAPFGLPLVEELLPDSFLRRMFGTFFRMLQENASEVTVEMQKEMQSLKQLLRSRLGWEYDFRVLGDLDDEDEDGDDDLPVIVDTSEPYAL